MVGPARVDKERRARRATQLTRKRLTNRCSTGAGDGRVVQGRREKERVPQARAVHQEPRQPEKGRRAVPVEDKRSCVS